MINLPKTAWIQGLKNSIFTLIPLIGIIGGAALTISTILKLSLQEGVSIAFIILLILLGVYLVFVWFRNKRLAGKLLLDVLPFPAWFVSIMNGVLGVIMLVVSLPLLTYEDIRNYAVFLFIFGLYLAAYNFAMAFSRIQVFENGLWVYLDLIRWDKIESYEWKDDTQKLNSLKLRFRGGLPAFLRNGVLPIPREKRNQLDILLDYYLANNRG